MASVPEGDTIHRTAVNLDRALGGKTLVRFDAPRLRWAPFPAGTVVEGVDAVGKHCLIHFDDGRTLRTHMRMTGSWHVYRSGERWRKPGHLARAVVEIEGWCAVCFAAPVVELEPSQASAVRVSHLGPDLTDPATSSDDIDRAADRMPEGEIGAVLLDQRVAAGIGNIFKSEACFAAGLDPWRPIGDLTDEDLRAVLLAARDLMLGAVATGRHPNRVYRRRGPCSVCGGRIASRGQGDANRTTYWCPGCQNQP